MRQTWWLRLAFAALVSLAVVDCGGDDGASGNGTDGTDDGNDDDTAGPNPLIEKIEGAWEITSAVRITMDADGNERREVIGPDSYRNYDWVQPADPNDPDCRSNIRRLFFTPQEAALGTPGDACFIWFVGPDEGGPFILDGERARTDAVILGSQGPCGEYHVAGRFLDGGRRFEYTVDVSMYTGSQCGESRHWGVTARWYTAECVSTIDEEYGCGIIPSPGYAIPSED